MSAEYYVDISQELITDPEAVASFQRITPPFKLLFPLGEDFARDMQRWLVRDEGASEELEGCVVDVTLKQHYKVTDKGQLNEKRELGPLHVRSRSVIVR